MVVSFVSSIIPFCAEITSYNAEYARDRVYLRHCCCIHRLGATYEPFDEFAEDLFAKYLLVCHGTRYKKAGKGRIVQ